MPQAANLSNAPVVSFPTFQPHLLLRGAHRQTIGAMYLARPPRLVNTARHTMELPDGDRPGNDPLALAASHEALLRWEGASGRLGNHGTPTMLFCGENDGFFENARETATQMGFEFVPLADTDHDGAFFSPGPAVKTVAKFMQLHLM